MVDIGGLRESADHPKIDDENFQLLLIFEMEPIKVEMFDCEQYIVTIDDLVVELIEALKFDMKEDSDGYN